MAADIVERLRTTIGALGPEAAAEILRLRAERDALRMELGTIANWPITHPQNMDAVNMATVARAALRQKDNDHAA